MALPYSLAGGTKTVATAGTAEKLVSSATPCKAVYIEALSTNTNNVYWGDSDVDNTYPALGPYDWRVIAIQDASLLYLDVDTDGEGVRYVIVV